MPQIRPSQAMIAAILALALGGCGDKNGQAVFSPEGGHPANWTATHKTSAKADLETCVECHGTGLDGGIAKVSCTKCHTSAPTSKHPATWSDYAYARHAATYRAEVAANPAAPVSCANAACHGTALTGVGAAPNCAVACHLGGIDKRHPSDWTSITGHKTYLGTAGNLAASCKTAVCHGTDGKGVFLSGPACDQCHSMK